MDKLNHYIVFRRTEGHCATWLLRANSLRDALLSYTLNDWCIGAELLTDGSLAVNDGYGGRIIYNHPLGLIEADEKIWNGGSGWDGWEIKQLQPAHWQARLAEVFCSEDPGSVEDYIALCRPSLRRRYPRSRARGFAWYLKDGPLVTFYRPVRRGRRWPIEILGRYHIPWDTWPEVNEWHGTYDDILEQMKVEYPLPLTGG
jgi:hypothetical protein